MTSTRPERAIQPSPVTRISYQVGSPWILDGKKFLPTTGTPIRKIDFMISELALADPVPLTLANLTTKSLTPAGALASSGIRLHPSRAVCDTQDFCMSQALVGQRSAHRPQCTQTSSSLTISLPVCFRARTGTAPARGFFAAP